jgi:hypothetical protein
MNSPHCLPIESWSSLTCITLSVSSTLSKGTMTTPFLLARRMTRSNPSGLTARVTMPSNPWLMKSSIDPSCAAMSVPVETTLNSLMSGAMAGSLAKVLAVFTIWMRHALPT